MKNLLTVGLALATAWLSGVGAGPAAAQTLGPASAQVWIGRPLVVSMPASFLAGDSRSECVHADVFYGDHQLPPHQVRTSVAGGPQQRRVRVEATPAINEPVVTVAVRAGCGSTVSRHYTLLPDVASDAVLAGLSGRSVQPGGALTTALGGKVPRLAAVAPTQLAGGARARSRALRPAGARAEVVPKSRPVALAPGRPSNDGVRLRLQNWEPDARTLLRITAHLTTPAQDAAARATAAMLWQAINADPSELIRTSTFIEKLEGELTQLRQSAGQTSAEMQSLQQRLDAPVPALVWSGIVRFLALLLLLAGSTAAYLWWRHRPPAAAAGSWSGAPEDSSSDKAQPARPLLHPVPPAAPQAFAPVADRKPATPDAPAAAVPRSHTRPAPIAAVAGAGPERALAGPAAVQPDRAEGSTMLRVETLAATFEEVESLASQSLWDDAMEVLNTYLEEQSAPAPLAFFELMRLCMNADDGAMLVSVRKRYAQVFGTAAPKFEEINSPLGLDGFPELAARIRQLWGTPEALAFIELSLFTLPADGKAISLQAGRDLLNLHDLSVALVRATSAGATDEAGPPKLASWATAENPALARTAAEGVAKAVGGHRFGLDLDLGVEAEQVPGDQPADPGDSALMREFQEALGSHAPLSRPATPSVEEEAFSAAVYGERSRKPGGS